MSSNNWDKNITIYLLYGHHDSCMMDASAMEFRTPAAVFVCSLALAYILVKFISFMWRSDAGGLRKPPSLRSLPLLGSIPFFPKDFATWHIYFMQKSFEMGEVIGFYVATR